MKVVRFEVKQKDRDFEEIYQVMQGYSPHGELLEQSYLLILAEDGRLFLHGQAGQLADLLNDGLRFREEYEAKQEATTLLP